MRRKFHTLDVFADAAFRGNPLAVVLDAQGLGGERMQAIAREFNLSETVFVLEPKDPVNTARIRIFTPVRELPFAGHPTVGTAVLLAQTRAPDMLAREDLRIVLEEGIGTVICSARHQRGRIAEGSFVVPHLPWEEDVPLPASDLIAAALGIPVGDIGFQRHVPSRWSAGNPFLFVPLSSLAAVARAAPDPGRLAELGGERPAVFLYSAEVAREGSHVHGRMFAPGLGVLEDPATGSAAAAFAGAAVRFEAPEDGHHELVIEQGFEMGRPSLIRLGLDIEQGALTAATVGGSVINVSEGTIDA